MRIIVNGKPRECREGMFLSDLLVELAVRRDGIAVEVNRGIIPKAQHGATPLREGDIIEILTFVGGG